MANLIQKAISKLTFVKQPKVPMQVVRNIYRQIYPYVNHAVWMDDRLENYIQQGYLRNPNLYAVINYIATQGSKVPWYEYEIVDEKAFRRYRNYKGDHRSENFVTAMKLQKKALREVEGGQLTKLLNKPNKYQTQALLMQNWIGFRRLCGNAYVWMNMPENGVNAGKPTELIFLPPQLTEIVWNNQVLEIAGYQLMYGDNQVIPADEVIHSKYWNPDFSQDGSNLYGLSPQQAGSRVITKNNEAYEFETKMVQNSGPPGLLVTETDTLTEDKIKKFYRQWDRRFRNNRSENVNTPLILSELGNANWIKTGMTPADALIMESKQMDLRDICNLHSINSAIFNDPENKTYNNMREAKRAAWHDAILCDLDAIKDDINMGIAPKFGNTIVDYDLQAIPDLQDNVKEQVEWLSQAWWIKGSEKRVVMGYEDDVELDWYPIPFGVQQGVLPPAEPMSDEDILKRLSLEAVHDYGNGRH